MDLGITGRVAFVAGPGRGIGAEICLALAAEGVRIAVNDLFQERADESAEIIRKSGGQAIGVAADVTDLAAVQSAVARAVAEFGAVDILVNNAGIPAVTAQDAIPSQGGFFKALAKESGRHSITVNCVSPATTETDATREWIQEQGEQIMRAYPLAKGLGRLGRPSDIANAVAFLASARSEWITGQVLSVNGGYSMVD